MLGRNWINAVALAHRSISIFFHPMCYSPSCSDSSPFDRSPGVVECNTTPSFPISVRSGDPVNVVQSYHVASLSSLPPSSLSSSLSSSSPLDASSLSLPGQSVAIFYDNVVKSHGVGLHLSCFSVDFDVMHQLLQIQCPVY